MGFPMQQLGPDRAMHVVALPSVMLFTMSDRVMNPAEHNVLPALH